MFGMVTFVSAHNGVDDGDGDINAVRVDVRQPSPPTAIKVNTELNVNSSVKIGEDKSGGDTSDGRVYKNSTSTENGTEKEEINSGAKAEVKSESGIKIASDHRSIVASLVLKLNADADKDGGIGPEVRAVAKEQASTSERIAVNVEKVQKRSKFWVFLFGSDYKAMGELRSDMKVTENSITRLSAALNKTTNASVKADLQTQINTLVTEDTKIDAFIDAHAESKGIVGWFK